MLVLGWYSPTVPSGFSNRMVNRVPTLLTSSSENIGRPNISTEADDIFENSYWTNSKKKLDTQRWSEIRLKLSSVNLLNESSW